MARPAKRPIDCHGPRLGQRPKTIVGIVSADRHLSLTLPPDFPMGAAEVIVLSDAPAPSTDDALVSPQASDLDALFESLKTLPPSGRTIEEIDRQVAEERDSWER